MLLNIASGFWQPYPTVGENYAHGCPKSTPALFVLPAIKPHLPCVASVQDFFVFL